MRRHLVLTDEAARHPFRQSLPPRVRELSPTVGAANGWRETLALSRDDARGFATSYIACLVAVAAFIF